MPTLASRPRLLLFWRCCGLDLRHFLSSVSPESGELPSHLSGPESHLSECRSQPSQASDSSLASDLTPPSPRYLFDSVILGAIT